MIRILLADNDPQVRRPLERLLLDKGYRVSVTGSGESALEVVLGRRPDLLIADADLPVIGGLDILRAVQDSGVKLPIIIIADTATTHEAIEAIKLGAFDYLLKPFGEAEFLIAIEQALQAGHIMSSPVIIDPEPATGGDALLGRSRSMQEIYKAIGRVAPTDATVLIRGESGTGKELVARAIYQHSTRAGKPFVVVNCVAIPESLLESELFGYEKGAFTGAASRRIGKIEHGHGGTVFLDEIGDMPLSIQAKILRLLQDKSIEPIGGREPIKVDVRIIAATNRNLEKAIAKQRFREDLFYRLNVVPLNLPPLRERREDVTLLAEYFVARHARDLGVRNPGLTKGACELLTGHDWPGNVRELANAMEQCLIFSRGHPIEEQDIASMVLGKAAAPGEAPDTPDIALRKWALAEISHGRGKPLKKMTDHLTKVVIAEALRLNQGNRTKVAGILGVSRPTLLAKMDKLGLK